MTVNKYCILRFAAAHIYAVWAAVGPLVGLIIGGWLAARSQRRKWVLDNKVAEYRGILDALNDYRWRFIAHNALQSPAQQLSIRPPEVAANEKHEAEMALVKAQQLVTDSLSDRIFTLNSIAQSGAREDWKECTRLVHEINSVQLFRMLGNVHDKLVKASQTDLKLPGFKERL